MPTELHNNRRRETIWQRNYKISDPKGMNEEKSLRLYLLMSKKLNSIKKRKKNVLWRKSSMIWILS
jgi:hypothetical protein